MLQFIKGQIRFVNKSLFACQLLLLCLYGLFTTMILKDSDGFLLLGRGGSSGRAAWQW